MALDFITGLIHLWCVTAQKIQETKSESQQLPNNGFTITSVSHEPSPPRCDLASPLTSDVLSGQKCDLVDQSWHEMIYQKFTRSELACNLEDAPPEALKGQSYELTCDREDKSQRFIELIFVSDAVAYQHRHDGVIICVYAGFNNKTKAKQWGEWLAVHHNVAGGFEIRPAKRLTGYRHELKLWGMSLKQIERLASCDLTKDPRSTYSDAPQRLPLEGAPKVRLTTVDDIAVGDVVRSRTVKFWQYRVLEIKPDGLLDCERIGVTPIVRVALHPSSIELVSKAGDVVETPSREGHLEAQAEAALTSIQPGVRWNPNLRGRKAAVASWEAVQARGGVNLRDCGTGTTPMEKWRQIEAEQKALAAAASDSEPEF